MTVRKERTRKMRSINKVRAERARNLRFLKKLFNLKTGQKQLEKNRELTRKKEKSGTGRENRKKIGNRDFQNEKNREFPTSREEWHP